MRRFGLLLAGLTLLTALLGGCVTRGFAEQENATANASWPAADRVWESHRFFDVWEVSYPAGWAVDRPGTGEIVLTGAYGEHAYRVQVARPTDVATEDVAAWVKSDVEAINQAGAPRQEISVKGLAALKVTNLTLPDQAEGACPAVRVYARTDKLTGTQNYLILTVTQTDAGACDPASLEGLTAAMIAQVKS